MIVAWRHCNQFATRRWCETDPRSASWDHGAVTTGGRRLSLAILIAAGVMVTASPAEAALAITVPTSTNLGSASITSASLTAHLGTVTVTDDRKLGLSWTATVSCTNFTTGGATAPETIPKVFLSYWSGPATATSGLTIAIPGQLTAAQATNLGTSHTAFSATGIALVTNSASWNPTLIVNVPAGIVAGTYTGTITHSVA